MVFINIINAGAFAMTMPITPAFIVNMGATLSFAGFVTGLISFVALFTRPAASLVGDRYNKKWLLMASTLSTGVVVLFYAFLPGVFWLLPTRILHGIFFSISGTLSFALGAHFVPDKRMGEGIGYLGVGQVLGMPLGSNAGIYIVQNYSYELCFILSGIILVTAGLIIIVLRYDHPASAAPGSADMAAEKSVEISVKKTGFKFNDLIALALLPNAIFAGLLMLGTGLSNSYLVMLGDERGISNIGLFFIVHAIVLLVSRPFLGKLADRRGVKYAIIPGFLFSAAAVMGISFSHALLPILFSALLMALGGGAFPAIQADCLKMLPGEKKALATGTFFIGIDTFMGISQIFGGVSIDYLGFSLSFRAVGILVLIGLVIYLFYSKRREAK